VLLAGSATSNVLVAVPTMGFLALATLVFVVFVRTDLKLTDLEAVGFLALYGLFLLWMTLESLGAIKTIHGL
jgi:cation:H+ antiporter